MLYVFIYVIYNTSLELRQLIAQSQLLDDREITRYSTNEEDMCPFTTCEYSEGRNSPHYRFMGNVSN